MEEGLLSIIIPGYNAEKYVERNIRVEYTVLPTYDTKKQRVTEKAILITIDNSDYDYINR